VSLERGGYRIACEISVTSTVAKCLAAGFSEVVLLSLKPMRLSRVRAAWRNNSRPRTWAGCSSLPQRSYHFTLILKAPPPPDTETVGSYHVRVEYDAPDEAARVSRARAIADLIARRVNEKKRGEI
jgi:hypothetical protein